MTPTGDDQPKKSQSTSPAVPAFGHLMHAADLLRDASNGQIPGRLAHGYMLVADWLYRMADQQIGDQT